MNSGCVACGCQLIPLSGSAQRETVVPANNTSQGRNMVYGLRAQSPDMTGIRAQRKGLRAQKNGIRDHKAFEPKSGIRFITRSKNLLSQYFSA